MSYLALNSWLEGEDVWRCTCSEISHRIFLSVFAMEGLSITKFQLVSQQNCIPYFCSCKDINQKGLKQVQRFQTEPQNALLVKERAELVSLYVISCTKGSVIFLRFWKLQDVALSDSLKFCFRVKAS